MSATSVAPDWLAIEGEYRAGRLAVREIARRYSVAESTIRKKAAAAGWVRNPGALKRERVAAHLAGAPVAGDDSPLGQAVAADAADMLACLATARAVIRRAHELALLTKDARALKALGEANEVAAGTIRRIRALDEPQGVPLLTKEHRDAVIAAALGDADAESDFGNAS